jgi:hypothetical protein
VTVHTLHATDDELRRFRSIVRTQHLIEEQVGLPYNPWEELLRFLDRDPEPVASRRAPVADFVDAAERRAEALRSAADWQAKYAKEHR